jgi:hypothetical protein
MDLLIGWQEFKTEFGGNDVTMELLPLKTSEYKLLSPFMRTYDIETYEGKVEAAQAAMDMQRRCELIFDRCVRNIQGITVNGEPPTPKQLSEEALLGILAQIIASQLILISSISSVESKNFGSPSGNSETKESSQEI